MTVYHFTGLLQKCEIKTGILRVHWCFDENEKKSTIFYKSYSFTRQVKITCRLFNNSKQVEMIRWGKLWKEGRAQIILAFCFSIVLFFNATNVAKHLLQHLGQFFHCLVFDQRPSRAEEQFPDTSWYLGIASWRNKKGENPLWGVVQWQKESERPSLCLLNNFEMCSSYTLHTCFYFLPTSDFNYQQECDIMGLHSASSDSVLPLATCPARIPLCKHSRNTRGATGREGNPSVPTARPPALFTQDRLSRAVWFVGWVFFFLCRQLWQPPPWLRPHPFIFHWDQLYVAPPKRRQTNIQRLLATVREWNLCVAVAEVSLRIRAVRLIDLK